MSILKLKHNIILKQITHMNHRMKKHTLADLFRFFYYMKKEEILLFSMVML